MKGKNLKNSGLETPAARHQQGPTNETAQGFAVAGSPTCSSIGPGWAQSRLVIMRTIYQKDLTSNYIRRAFYKNSLTTEVIKKERTYTASTCILHVYTSTYTCRKEEGERESGRKGESEKGRE